MCKKRLIILCLMMLFCISLGVTGCATTEAHDKNITPMVSVLKPVTQKELDSIPKATYEYEARDPNTGNTVKEIFEWPIYVAIGDVKNETGAYETAAAGQVNYSTVLGMATRKYWLSSASRTPALKASLRDPDREAIRRILMEVGGEGNILAKLTPLPEKVIEEQIWRKLIPPELYISGALAEVNIAEKSAAAGLSFAGIGLSGKVVETSVTGSIEITDIYTGEMLKSVMGQNRVVAHQVGFDAFRIVSAFGLDDQYLNAEVVFSQEIIKQKVQAELVDYLYYVAFTELMREKPEILIERLHYRVGRIHGYAAELAKQKGFELVNGSVRPVEVLALPKTRITKAEGITISTDQGFSKEFIQLCENKVQ